MTWTKLARIQISRSLWREARRTWMIYLPGVGWAVLAWVIFISIVGAP